MIRTCFIRATFACLPFVAASSGFAQDIGSAKAHNMRLAGYSDLQGRTAYQPVIQRQGQRWIAYVGHHGDRKLNPLNGRVEDNGTSVFDVTDVRNPRYLSHIPGDEGRQEQVPNAAHVRQPGA